MSTSDHKAASSLAQRVAIVTGGSSGIGQAIACALAERGALVGILDISKSDDTRARIAALGGTSLHVPCDVSVQTEVDQAFAQVQAALGGVHVLVNSAGIAHIGTVEQTTEADLDRVYAVNVKGVYNCLRAAVAVMKHRGGVILNIASVASTVGIPDRFAYSMSKGAVLTMTYSVARDYVAQGIRCNCIAPARVHTPFVDGYLATSYPGRETEMFQRLSATQPIGRMGSPAEIALLACFLCSDDAAFITGSNYAIDGGFVSLKM